MPVDNECFEKVGLFFSARQLPKMDVASQTDGFIVLYLEDPKTKQLKFIGNTEVVRDTSNPDFASQIMIDYTFELPQKLIIKMYDQDDKAPILNFASHDFIGETSFSLSALMCSKDHKVDLKLTGGPQQSRATITIRGETIANTRDVFVANFAAQKLSNKEGFFSTSDPFLVISRLYEDGGYGVIWKNDSQYVKSNLNPKFPLSRIPMLTLCNGDINRPLRIEIKDYESNGNHKHMGMIETSVKALLDGSGTAAFNVIEEEKKKKNRSYVNSGTLTCVCEIETHATFSDYLMGGLEVNLAVAIDFTGSNGSPDMPSSLHYIYPGVSGHLNQYQQAILSVGSIVIEYDTDKLIPVYGFGAKVKLPGGGYSPVQHCFPIYGGSGEVQGIDGLLQAYKDGLSNVALSGPTLFSPLLENFCAIVSNKQCSQTNQSYTVLLILTDGEVNDMQNTIDSIIKASSLPMSIIIVGVGSADFGAMVQLDSDDHVLRSGSVLAKRDIVQFVPFGNYISKGNIQLAQDVLAEVPTQVISYMEMNKIVPNKR